METFNLLAANLPDRNVSVNLRNVLHFRCEIPSGGRRRQCPALLVVNRNCLFDDLAEFVEYFFFIVAVAAA